MSCKKHKHPLKRSGTNQQQRLTAGLKDDYIEIDEKTYADWIVFASNFSSYLKYFNLTSSTAASGTWKPFFENDISAILGVVAVQNINNYRLFIKSKLDGLRSDDHQSDTAWLKENFSSLYDCLLTLSLALDDLIYRLPDEPPLRLTIRNLIQLKLRSNLNRLLAYYKSAISDNLLTESNNNIKFKIFNQQILTASSVINLGLSNDWIHPKDPVTPPDPDWQTYFNNITADSSIFGDPSGNIFQKINHAANHNLYTGIFDQFLASLSKIISDAEAALLVTLSKWDTHQAHYALFLSFLRMYRTAQLSINTIKKRHLDFYYREVLQLKPSDAQANYAHIIIELAKQSDTLLLKTGTEFKAGKDSEGKEVIYALDKDTVFNKARIAKLMSVYMGSSQDNINTAINNKRLFAAPVINSSDGLGQKLTSQQGEWHPFVNKTFAEGELVSIDIPYAQIGFAVASHFLFLTEGERKVSLKISTSNNAALLNLAADTYLTTEKGWLRIGTILKAAGTMSDTSNCVIFSFTLNGTEPPITNYNAEVHGGSFNCDLPILKIYLMHTSNIPYQYDILKDITISKIEIEVKAGDIDSYSNTGLKQLVLSTDTGPIDGSKPFQPFGPLPRKGSSLIIGSREVFSKKNSKIKLNIEWANLPQNAGDIDYDVPYTPTYYPNVSFSFLYGGNWKQAQSEVEIFNMTNALVPFPASASQAVPAQSVVNFADEYNLYDINSSKGFFKLTLNRDFGHKGYQDAQIAYLIAEANSPGSGSKPTEPYTPVIQSLFLSYSASVLENPSTDGKTAFDDRSIRFFHIYPFGETEQHNQISSESNIFLLPQFKHYGYNEESELFETHQSIGEFYLGFENLKAGQNISVLFQVLEGSTNPLIQKPEDHIRWSYLAGDKWIAFKSSSISDQTKQLIQSGIIEFAIPEDAYDKNIMLPGGYIWLKASISTAPDAICKILAVLAQAAVVTFQPRGNANDFLDSPLPSGSISKLKEPQSAVKKVEQPYSSLGGLPKEADSHFYIRVSERLRHKKRAITIWDYERLVLEAFPQIHKVKCISHTKLVPDEKNPAAKIYSELAPGYVTVITIPNLKNRNDTDPLKPYTSTDLLVNIKNFIKSKATCHAKIITENPLFEELRMEFTLKLMKGFTDKVFYKKLLQQEITQFLTPWAYDSNVDVQFRGKVYKSVLIDFIEERPYVDFITDVKLYQTIEQVESGDLEEAVGSTERSVLVSVPSGRHEIYVLPDEDELIEEEVCEPYGRVDHHS